MAVVGFFKDSTEMLKLVQTKLLAGVVQEIYEDGQLIAKLPVTLIDSYKLIWNREKALPTASPMAIGEQYTWANIGEFTAQVELQLKEYGDQWRLDNIVQDTYKNPNDYRAVIMKQIVKGCLRSIEDDIIYGNATTYPKEFNGLDRLCPAYSGDNFVLSSAGTYNSQCYDEAGGAMSVAILRDLIDKVKPRPDILLMPRVLRNLLSAAAFEVGLASTAPGRITYGIDQFGIRIDYFDGVPIMVSDYLVMEETSVGGKDTGPASGRGSVYAIRFGEVEDGGVSLAVGGGTGGQNFFQEETFDKLENYNGTGIRMFAYVALAMGSTKSVARIHDISLTTAVVA